VADPPKEDAATINDTLINQLIITLHSPQTFLAIPPTLASTAAHFNSKHKTHAQKLGVWKELQLLFNTSHFKAHTITPQINKFATSFPPPYPTKVTQPTPDQNHVHLAHQLSSALNSNKHNSHRPNKVYH
jgi:hypothetical protein